MKDYSLYFRSYIFNIIGYNWYYLYVYLVEMLIFFFLNGFLVCLNEGLIVNYVRWF